MIVNLDSGTGKAVLDKAKAQGIGTIDYDRLTLNGGADYYVSFDNVAVGKLQGEGLVKCLTDKGAKNPVVAELNGSPTDNNATLFKQGYDSVLQPKYDCEDYIKGPDQSVPDWDNTQGGTIFEQMLTRAGNKIDGVLAANDGLGNAAITVLKRNKLNGKVPVTGQDATVQGLQNILAGDQCMTVYKAVKQEADAASALAIALAKGEHPDHRSDREGHRVRARTSRPSCSSRSPSSRTTSRTSSPTASSPRPSSAPAPTPRCAPPTASPSHNRGLADESSPEWRRAAPCCRAAPYLPGTDPTALVTVGRPDLP